MYRGLTICLTICWCGAAVVPIKNEINKKQGEQSDVTNQRTLASIGIDTEPQIYPVVHSNQPTINRYIYPSYPEYGNNGYAIQTGYEGYLVPAVLPQQNTDSWIDEIGTSLFPSSEEILLYGIRAGIYLLHFLFAIILGGAFTTMICTFTPVCTIDFIGFGLVNNHQVKKQITDTSRSFLTEEAVNVATILITKALDNYATMQRERSESPKRKEKLDDSPRTR